MVQCPVTGVCWYLCPSLSTPHHLFSALCIFNDRAGSQRYIHLQDTSFQDITLLWCNEFAQTLDLYLQWCCQNPSESVGEDQNRTKWQILHIVVLRIRVVTTAYCLLTSFQQSRQFHTWNKKKYTLWAWLQHSAIGYQDFLTNRPQTVQTGSHISSTLVHNDRAHQGCVLSPPVHISPFHIETPHYLCSGGCQFSAFVCSHWTKQLRRKAAAVCPFIQPLALQMLKRSNGTCHVDEVCVFLARLLRCPPVNLNMYPLTVYNYIDAVIMCSDWDPDPSNILESDISPGSYIITLSPSVHWTLSDFFTGREGCRFLGESSLKSQSGGRTLWFFQDSNYRHCFSGWNVTKSHQDRQDDRHFPV